MALKDIWPDTEDGEAPWHSPLDPLTLVLLMPGYEFSQEDIEALEKQEARLLPGWSRRDKSGEN